ncbi:hypothetical protein RI129_003829 [Pyrocoelia pectoralis]|uniref:Uncharacterized protein n=1 Tax=Pyrocoelia pectoralis TaxID=417401 RepID=A0AAN7ZNF7_9COLE
MQPSAPPSEVREDVSDSPPTYNEVINMKTLPHNPLTYHAINYGACPTPPPPPYTPSPSRTGQNGKVYAHEPESGMMVPLNAASSNFRPVESSVRKKYAAYVCCAFFLIIIMVAAYLGKNNKKHNYRHNYEWNF